MVRPVRECGNRRTALVVEGDSQQRAAIARALRGLGFEVLEAASCADAIAALAEAPDVVVTDLRLGDGDAMSILPHVRAADAKTPVVVVTSHGTIDLAVRAVKLGVDEFLTKPVDLGSLCDLVAGLVERARAATSGMHRRVRTTPSVFVSRCDAMRRVEDQVERLRDADCSVLLLGETGTGKSTLARRIHDIGARKQGAFVDINCAGLARDFVDSELFGHERGAFTGAHAAKPGLFEMADGGTLFLDEIGDVDLAVQPKLLKVLEEKRFRRMGDTRERKVDVRLVAATHHDLLQASSGGRFRADLYYRISTVTLLIPPLRERREDLVPLALYTLARLGAPDVDLAPDARDALLAHAWPGNLRELRNVLERACLARVRSVIRAEDLSFDRAPVERSPAALSAPPAGDVPGRRGRTLSEMEREHIKIVLAEERGHVEAAARRLGIPRSTLYQRIRAYGISASQIRKAAPSIEPPDGDDSR